jgi:NarL family two-component system response regulator LiaR
VQIEEEPTMTQPIRVLIVDDHAIVRKGISALLSTEPDIQVLGRPPTAQKASRSRDAAARRGLDGYGYAEMDGIEATRRITALDSGPRVLVLTSFAADDKVFPAIKAGALGYLLKDSGPNDLIRAIRQVYRGEPSLEPAIASKVLFELAHPPKAEPTTDPLRRDGGVGSARAAAPGRSARWSSPDDGARPSATSSASCTWPPDRPFCPAVAAPWTHRYQRIGARRPQTSEGRPSGDLALVARFSLHLALCR